MYGNMIIREPPFRGAVKVPLSDSSCLHFESLTHADIGDKWTSREKL